MTLLDLVRREAKRRGAADAAALRALPPTAWREAESQVMAETESAPRGARALVAAYGRAARRHGGAEPLGRAARLHGSWLAYVGRNGEAIAAYRRAIRLLEGDARIGAQLGLAAALLRVGRFRESVRVSDRLRRDAAAAGRPQLVALAAQNMGVALQESGDLAGAETSYREALAAIAAGADVPPAAPTIRARAAVEDNLANVLASLDRFDDAERLQASACAGFDAIGLANEAARCRGNRGALLAWTDRLGAADALLRAAESAFRRAGDPLHAALARRDRGETLLRAGLVPEARHALDSSSRALRAVAPPIEIARTAHVAARAALAAGDAAAARSLLRSVPARTADAAESLEIQGRASAVDGGAGAGDGRRKLVAAAKRFGARRPAGRARCLAAAAWCAEAAGDVAGARRLAADAERAAAGLPVPSVRFAAAAARFLAETSGTPRRVPADAALARAVDALETLRGGLGPDAMRSALLRGREAWLARALRHLLDGPDGPRRALAFLERWRARSLVDLLADAGRDDAPAETDAASTAKGGSRADALRRVVAALENRAEGAPAPGFLRAPIAPAPTLLRRLRAAERELLDELRHEGAPPARPFTERDLDSLRSGLPDDALVVAPVEEGDRVVLLVVSRRGVRAVGTAVPATAVRDAAGSLLHALGAWTLGEAYVLRHASRLRRGVDSALAQLAEALLAPLDEEIARAARLVVVPSGPWHHVPIAALPWRGRALVERMPVTLVPALAALRETVPAAAGRSVVVAAADAAAPAARSEAEAVAETLGAALFADLAATSAAMAGANDPACLHVAAHGRHRADAPAASGVRLADGWFRAAEFARLRLRGSLVVLSGCETGVAAVGTGDEAMGLVRGVFAAGAADVIASLWRIDDAATAGLMRDLHARRAAGASPATALADVQRERAAAGAPPWHWAGFVHHARRV